MRRTIYINAFWMFLAAVVFLAAVPSASANSNTYDVTATFADGQVLDGNVTYNTGTGVVTGYTFTLTGATGTDTCSGVCSTLSLPFTYGSYAEKVSGFLSPTTPLLGFTVWNNGGYYNYTVSDAKWTPVQVPEGPALIMLIFALAAILFVAVRSPRLRAQLR
jgi:hypothetical protein